MKTVIRILTQNDVNIRFQLLQGKVLTAENTDQAVHVLAKQLQIVSKLYVHSHSILNNIACVNPLTIS